MPQIRLKTKTATEVRRTLSRIMNMVVNEEMDNTIILGCNAVLSAIRTDEQQHRINELEKILEEVTANQKGK